MMVSRFSTQWEVIHLRVYSWVCIYKLQWKLFCGSDGFCRCPFKIQVFFASFKYFSCMSADIQEKPGVCSRVVCGITWSHFDTSVWCYGFISIQRVMWCVSALPRHNTKYSARHSVRASAFKLGKISCVCKRLGLVYRSSFLGVLDKWLAIDY